jgi:hypothetical protein
VIVGGREIEPTVLEWIRIEAANLSSRKLARGLCERLDWKGPGGRLRVSVAVGVLRRLQELKIIALRPAEAPLKLMVKARRAISPATAPDLAVVGSLEQVAPVELMLVGSR